MSKTILAVLSIIAISALILVGYYSFNRLHKNSKQLAATSQIVLYVTNGDVSYKLTNASTFQKATTSPITLLSGSQVDTGQGRATIIFPDNSSVDLDMYTELTVTYEDHKTLLYQTLGNTYHRVTTLLNGSTYEVKTPNTLAAVRGTKFAVNYNKHTDQTKVAVTEHKVQVSSILGVNGETFSTIVLDQGKTVRVDTAKENTGTSTNVFSVTETVKDSDMNTWVEENKEIDSQVETEGISTLLKTETRAPNQPQKNEKEDTSKSEEPELKKSESTEKSKETTPAKVESVVTTKPAGNTGGTVKKIDEDTFFDAFNTLFINNFYIDEKDSTCRLTAAPEERVRAVTAYAAENGYPISSKTLLSFATAINAYCKNKDAAMKSELQGRFDVEFPFKEDL